MNDTHSILNRPIKTKMNITHTSHIPADRGESALDRYMSHSIPEKVKVVTEAET